MTVPTSPAADPGGRARCFACHKPRVTCVCARVPRIDNRTFVRVLQHPRERFHPIGTARFLALGLSRVRVDVAYIEEACHEPSHPTRAALLYPSADALPLEDLPAAERPTELVVVDGTWDHARSLRKSLGWLAALPKVKLTVREPSRYRIRREPRFDCLSTLEAVVAALRVLEPDTTGFDALLAAFDGMIDDQLAFILSGRGARRMKVRRERPWRALPRALVENIQQLVVAYAETERIAGGGRELVQLTAMRLESGECFDHIVRGGEPEGLRHMKLSLEQRASGVSREELRSAWSAFVAPGSPITAWNQSTLDALATADLGRGAFLLKAAYANAVQRGPGTLEKVLEREGLSGGARAPVRGRAGLRLAGAARLARFLHQRALGPA